MTNKAPKPVLFIDRLTNTTTNKIEPNDLIPGRWILDLSEEAVFQNSVAASLYDFVIPDLSGKWNILNESGDRNEGVFSKSLIPEDLEVDSIRTIGDVLSQLIDSQSTWAEWVNIVPLVPELTEDVDLHSLEVEVRDNLGHLEMVCQNPRMHLHVEVERVIVSKAKRVPPQAVSYLASHTEDWDRPLIRGIMPKRILAEVRHDQFDIYENRVSARLVDNLISYLTLRIQKLRKLLKVFQDKEDYSSDIAGTYQRHQRISALWGESIDENEGKKKVEKSLHELEWLKYKLMGFLGAVLYKEVPRRTYVPRTLKNTNIFTNDQHYSHVAELWREWASTGADKVKSPKQYYDDVQGLYKGMNAFTMLLILRALETLNYTPDSTSERKEIFPGSEIQLINSGQFIRLQWSLNGTVSIRINDQKLNIVGLPIALGFCSNDQVSDILSRFDHLLEKSNSSENLILYLGENDSSKSLDVSTRYALHTVGNDPRYSNYKIACLPISPWEIASTERIVRALRWFLSNHIFLSYPLHVDVPNEILELANVKENLRWLLSDMEKSTVEIKIPPREYEWDQIGFDLLHEQFVNDCVEAEKRFKEIEENLKKAGRDRDLAKKKYVAIDELVRCKKNLKALKKVINELARVKERSVFFLQCPTCGTEANSINDFEPRGKDSFHCTCSSCSTFWSIQKCSNGHCYPTMLPSGDFFEVSEEIPGWVDRIYGGDILAVPGKKQDGSWGFVCPDCGEIN